MQKQKIAVITGASKGIGRGIAYRLADEGYDIAVNYRSDHEGAEETATKVRERGSRALVLQGDVGRKNDVDVLFDRVLEKWGPPWALINNAGVQSWKSLLELEEGEWDRTIRTNLKGTFLCTQRAAREMVPRGGGRIVNIGSGSNKVPFPRLVDYTSSKGGIEMFTRVAAVELGPKGITVNCIAPGAIEIERTQLEAPDYGGTWAPLTPCQRIGHVEDVASAVAYLVSHSAEFITGQTLYVDGGLFTRPVWPYAL